VGTDASIGAIINNTTTNTTTNTTSTLTNTIQPGLGETFIIALIMGNLPRLIKHTIKGSLAEGH
jgi:hypothetical protein